MPWHYQHAVRGEDETDRSKRPPDACLDGAHDLYKPPGRPRRKCKHCGCGPQALYSAPKSAQKGDFRVVCREPDCDYGDFEDAEGNGYTNHTLLCMAQPALLDHQRDVGDEDDPSTWHDVAIQQHPVEEIVGPD